MIDMTHNDRLRNIVRTYRAFQDNPQMVLPTALMLLLEAAGLALDEDDRSRYADAMSLRDRMHEGRTEHDLTTTGVPAKAGA